MQPRWVSGAPPCVDDEALFALARGELARADLARVEAHLRDCSDCRAVLGEAARSLPTNGDAEANAGGPRRIARYELRDLLGAGASGVVYRAIDPKLQRTVAIKVLHADTQETPELSARMLREAQAMARLSAATVVTVYDVGIEDGAVYLVMEYIDGSTLSAWLGGGSRTVSDILAVFADAGQGLFAAHEKGLVHRDFKPENVLVAADGRARVTDFGLAREEQPLPSSGALDAGTVVSLYTPTRGLVGTPAYIAPELFAGAQATPKSDQFAFCVALFAALFERHPFRAGEGITLEQLSQLARTHGLLTPSELGLRGARALRLYMVIERGLSASPAQRFGDMGELLSALARASRERVRRSVVAALAASLLVLGVVLGVRTWQGDEAAITQSTKSTQAPEAPAQSGELPGRDLPPAPVESVAAPVQAPHAKGPRDAAPPPPEKRRAKRKSGDVRYRDWLKDPF